MIRNNISQYGLIAKIFHWITFFFLIIQIPFGFYISELEFSMERANFENYHSLSGIVIFYIVLVRLIWKFLNPSPKILGVPLWQMFIARINHFLLYVFMLMIIISGVLKKFYIEATVNLLFFNIQSSKTVFKLSDFFSTMHELSNIILIALILLHILAVVFHHLVLKDKILKKIT